MNTKQHILEVSADLFNRFGVEIITSQRLAQALGISTGLLTYHYPKKSQILTAHLCQFERELQKAVQKFPTNAKPRFFGKSYIGFIKLIWRYQFLFVGATHILQAELVDAEGYQRLVTNTKKEITELVERLMSVGMMRSIPAPLTVEMFVDSMWWQWLGFLLVAKINHYPEQPSDHRLLADSALAMLYVAHDYIDPAVFIAVRAELKIRCAPDFTPSSAARGFRGRGLV